MGRFLRRRQRIVCREAVELMSAYLDDALGATDRARLERHLEDCPHCTEYLAQLRATVAALGHVEPDEVDPAALGALVALYRRWQADD